ANCIAYPSLIENLRNCSPCSVTVTVPSVNTPSTSKKTALIFANSLNTIISKVKKKVIIIRQNLCDFYKETHVIFMFKVKVGFFCRSEEHTSELQSRENLVCRLL